MVSSRLRAPVSDLSCGGHDDAKTPQRQARLRHLEGIISHAVQYPNRASPTLGKGANRYTLDA